MGVNLRGYLSVPPIHVVWPLAGHAGDCAKVLTATVFGHTDAACDCVDSCHGRHLWVRRRFGQECADCGKREFGDVYR
jgi:hypothetical protein